MSEPTGNTPGPDRMAVLGEFWLRFVTCRFTFAGSGDYYAVLEDKAVRPWKERIFQELAAFLHHYRPDPWDFVRRAGRVPMHRLDDTTMSHALSEQVAARFRDWLEARGLPGPVAARATSIYRIRFLVPPRR